MRQTADHTQQYLRPEPTRDGRAAPLAIAVQFATGSRRGGLVRKRLQTPKTNPDLAHRFDKIETGVVLHQQQLRDAADAPVRMAGCVLAEVGL